MAKGLVCPGFHPFIANIASVRSEVCEGMTREESMAGFKALQDPWLYEYFTGHENEAYRVELPDALRDVPIPSISACLYKDTGCALIRYQGIFGIVRTTGRVRAVIFAPDWETVEYMCK